MIQYINVYSLTISTLNILVNITYMYMLFYRMVQDKMGTKPGFDIFVFQSCFAVIN